ncbi:LysM peptidoglycan-binding domain-containing protein [Tumebacillus permanentifrigoris]|uniref:Stage VI sporulation protein D n=1 Tax=Tumebacillus permanentifrigoris TaxID=378543 RepID=A0A316DCU6_9BACL|nr:LysM peptidoglycan-binding domain-containing protein [Tumebacillus permanentifrigoris]PWK15785.1 stage VI sporulation protein D [Tumebacillus permanentifrigoris]
MAESENKPSIRIHVDQQITIEGVRGQEEVEDATVATEITGFDVEDDLYVLRGALSFSGFFRQVEEEDGEAELPDAFDDRDVFAAGEELSDAPVLPFHHRLPFLLQVPVTAQEVHQRESGSLYVNPKIGQWNVHVLGEETIHLRAELVLQGLSGQEGYVFRCGSQEEGVKPATSLDHLLDQEESRAIVPPALEEEEFEAPFENAWASNYRQQLDAVEAPTSEDDWLIESPAPDAQSAQAEYTAEQEESEDDDVILFTPDPRLVFPVPEAVDQIFPHALPLNEQDLFDQAQAMFEDARRQFPELQDIDFEQASREVLDQFQVNNLEELQRNLFEQAQAFQPEAFLQEGSFEPPLQPYQPIQSSASTSYHEAYNRIVAQHGTPSPVDEDAFVVEDTDVHELTELSHYEEDVRSEAVSEVAQHEQSVYEEVVHDEEVPSAQALDSIDAVEAVEATETVEAQDESNAEDTDRPILDVVAEQIEAEYEFEDEVPESQVILAAPEVVEQPHASGPKLSVGSKSSFDPSTGVKLSALLGESRPREQESHTFGSIVGNNGGSITERAIVSNNGNNGNSIEDVPPVYSQYDSAHDSVWGNFLRQKETKTTLKFRIVHEADSLGDLAEQYNTTPSELQRANRLQRQEVEAGQILYIPTKRR